MSENRDLIITYLDTINNRSIEIKRELDKLKYLLDLKRSKIITSTVKVLTDEDKKQFITKQKMYLSKLNDNVIKAPKPETLEYYSIYKDENEYKIKT